MSCLLQDGKEEAAVCLEAMHRAIAELPDEGTEEVPDLTVEEYNLMPADQKSPFFRPAAKKHMMDTGGPAFPCSLLEDKGGFLPRCTQADPPNIECNYCMFSC